MPDLFSHLNDRAAWLFDGGMGTQLQRHDLDVEDCPEAWNLDKPEVVLGIHQAYVQAGSDVIQTNTFGGNLIRLTGYDLGGRTVEINARGVELARQAAGEEVAVAGSVGPIGEVLEPFGDVPRDRALEAFQTQARGLGEADYINIETMGSLEEALVALEAVRSVLELPISVSMTFNHTPKGYFTMMGESIEHCAQVLEQHGAAMVGSNCGEGLEQMIDIILAMRAVTKLPLLAKPNAGIPSWHEGKEVYPETPESLAPKARKLFAAGAQLCGGCCGTTPEHIRVIRQVADAVNSA